MKKTYQVICLLIMAFLFFTPVQTFAVAGGHGGGSTGGGSGGGSIGGGSNSYYRRSRTTNSNSTSEDFLFVGLSLGSIFVFSLFKKKKRHNMDINDLLSRMPGTKREKKKLLSEINRIFYAIQKSWEEEAPEKVRNCYTLRLFEEHQQVLQKNKDEGVRNHTTKIAIQELANYRQINDTSFSIRIDFSCFDYLVDRKNQQLISGDKRERLYFSQVWYFNYSEKDKIWQADFIQPIFLD